MFFSFFILITDFFSALVVNPLINKCWVVHFPHPQGLAPEPSWTIDWNLMACTASSGVGSTMKNLGSYSTSLLVLTEQRGRCILQGQMFLLYIFIFLSLSFFLHKEESFLVTHEIFFPHQPIDSTFLYRSSWVVSQFHKSRLSWLSCHIVNYCRTWWQNIIILN